MFQSLGAVSGVVQDTAAIESLKLEVQKLQKLLSEKEDFILSSRRLASDKVRTVMDMLPF